MIIAILWLSLWQSSLTFSSTHPSKPPFFVRYFLKKKSQMSCKTETFPHGGDPQSLQTNSRNLKRVSIVIQPSERYFPCILIIALHDKVRSDVTGTVNFEIKINKTRNKRKHTVESSVLSENRRRKRCTHSVQRCGSDIECNGLLAREMDAIFKTPSFFRISLFPSSFLRFRSDPKPLHYSAALFVVFKPRAL